MGPVSSSTIRTINRLHGLELKVQESFSTLRDSMNSISNSLSHDPTNQEQIDISLGPGGQHWKKGRLLLLGKMWRM